MTNLPTLYKRSATGATQQWIVGVSANPDGSATIRVTYGQVGGKMQTTETVVKAGKNHGKTNATDCYQQAKSEALSRWKKQKDKGYGESVEVTEPDRKPMLAQDYRKHKHNVKFPCHVQPKLDGIRCLAHKDGGEVRLVSRMGKPIDTVRHINECLKDAMKDGETWDGELFVEGVPFQTLVSWIKRAQPDSSQVQYHIYDAIADEDFFARYTKVWSALRRRYMSLGPSCLVPVTTWVAESHDEIQGYHNECVEQGFEGVMVRTNGCPYKVGFRSRDLLKVKAFCDEEFEIVGATEGKGKFEGMAVFRLRTREGAEFDCLPEGSEEVRRAYWRDRDAHNGKFMTVRFFEWTSSTPPLPRFPIGVAIRDFD